MIATAGIENRIRFDAGIHEAGHAVVGLAQGLDLSHVLIRPDGTGLTSWRLENAPETPVDPAPPSTAEPTERAARLDAMRADPAVFESLLAGLRHALGSREGIVAYLTMIRAAREAQLVTGCPVAVAEWVAADDGITEDLLLASFGERDFYKVDSLTRARAASLVRMHWKEITALACALMERGRLDADQVRRVLKGENADRRGALEAVP